MNTGNLPGMKDGWRARLTTSLLHLWAYYLENVVVSTSHNPMALHGLLQG
jgi:hypothetical protein